VLPWLALCWCGPARLDDELCETTLCVFMWPLGWGTIYTAVGTCVADQRPLHHALPWFVENKLNHRCPNRSADFNFLDLLSIA
jgi:hypothetical protein